MTVYGRRQRHPHCAGPVVSSRFRHVKRDTWEVTWEWKVTINPTALLSSSLCLAPPAHTWPHKAEQREQRHRHPSAPVGGRRVTALLWSGRASISDNHCGSSSETRTHLCMAITWSLAPHNFSSFAPVIHFTTFCKTMSNSFETHLHFPLLPKVRATEAAQELLLTHDIAIRSIQPCFKVRKHAMPGMRGGLRLLLPQVPHSDMHI